MAEETQNEEQPTFVIADRRKFNADGSLREGVNLAETKPASEKPAVETTPQETITENPATTTEETAFTAQFAADLETEATGENGESGDDELDERNIPGAENPASFANFLLSLASQAAAAMGMTENPMTGRRSADLELSRYWLDVLGMLHEKTSGNLHPQEKKLFDTLLGDLRLQYLRLQQLAEEQQRRQNEALKQQAAQKFSGKDILGR